MTSPCVVDVTNILFNEIIYQSKETKIKNVSDTVDVYVIQVQPQDCGRVIKWLSKELPLLMHVSTTSSSKSSSCSTCDIIHDLSHLKRVGKKFKKSTIEKQVTILHNTTTADILPLIKKAKHSIESTETLTKDALSNRIWKSKNYKDEKIQVLLHVASWLEEASSESNVDNIDLCQTNLDILLEKLTIHLNSSITRNVKTKTNTDTMIDNVKVEATSFIVSKESVPGRNAITEDEWRTFNNIWPIHYFPNQMVEHLKESQSLTQEEQEKMIIGMKAAIDDRYHNTKYNLHGTVIVDPKNGQIISKSYDEYCIQQNLFETTMRQQNNHNNNNNSNDVLLCQRNPLVTSIILACQGVSRIERQNAQNHGMNNDIFQKGQYICTGYDVYTTFEPTTYEAMALIHSRINRLIFGCSSVSDNLPIFHHANNDNINTESNCIINKCQPRRSSGIIQSQVHAIPGLNHKYRAFQCKQKSDVWSLCCQSYRNDT